MSTDHTNEAQFGQAPSDDQLIALLQSLQVQPSVRYYAWEARAPWIRAAPAAALTSMETQDRGNRVAIETLAALSHDAFEGDPVTSLLANLRALREQDWTAVPPGGARSVADMLEHVGWGKWMYHDYAFGPGTLRGNQPPQVPAGGAHARPREALLLWLVEGHRQWLSAVLALQDDTALEQERLTTWGEQLPTGVLIRILINHDVYHAGEINHLRALLQGNDRWPYD